MSYDQTGNSDLPDNLRSNRGATLGPYDYIFLGYRLGVRNSANTFHQYFMGASALTANRLITMPEIDADDILVARASIDTLLNKTFGTYVTMNEVSAPSAPAADTVRFYAKDNGSGTTELYYKNSGGAERDLSNTGGGGGGSTSYLDDLLDVVIAGVTNNQFLRFNSGSGLWENQTVSTTHAMLSATHTDSLAAAVSLGDVIHGNSTPAWARLAGNTTTTKKFLTQTGDGVNSAVPGWNVLVGDDMPASVLQNTLDNDLGSHYFDMTRIATPSSPSANKGRFYVKQVDANNDGVFTVIKRNNSFVEVQVV